MLLNNTQELIDLIPDLIFYKDLKGVYTNCNKAFLEFVNYKKFEVIGKTDHQLFSADNADLFRQVDMEILETGISKTFEETFTLDNGKIYYFNTSKQVLYNNEGLKIGLFCIARDITEQKEYELIYKDNQLLLEYIATQSSLKKIFEKIIHLSEQRNTGTKCSILLLDETGKHLHEGVAPSLPNFYNEAIDGIEIGQGVGSCGTAAFSKQRVIVENIDVHEYWQPYLELTQQANLHACWSEPIFSSNNEVLGTFAIYNSKPKKPTEFELKHISSFAHMASVAIEKNKIQKLLEDKNNLLMSKSRIASIGEMLENISHHWRQPLSVISTEASGIKLKKEYDQLSKESFEQSIDNILHHTQQLSDTLNNFKKYSLNHSTKEYFKLDKAVDQAIFILEASLQSKKVHIKKNVTNNEIFALENAFIHALVNILKNSCDTFQDDSNYIEIVSSQTEESMQLSIKDNGGGIDENIIHKIFDPYFTTKHKSFGTGSGLYICKEIIESQMNGTLEVKNTQLIINDKPYTGAEFIITLQREHQ